MSKILGIDLGTTNSLSVMEGRSRLLSPTLKVHAQLHCRPFAKNGERLVGQAAKRQAVTNPNNTIFSAKRFIGRKFDEVQEVHLCHKIVQERTATPILRQRSMVSPSSLLRSKYQQYSAKAEG